MTTGESCLWFISTSDWIPELIPELIGCPGGTGDVQPLATVTAGNGNAVCVWPKESLARGELMDDSDEDEPK